MANKENKKWYGVGLSAEADSDGWVQLTEDEARIVEYATNPANWKKKNINAYSGVFVIDTGHPRESL